MKWHILVGALLLAFSWSSCPSNVSAQDELSGERVRNGINLGIKFLKGQQFPDGEWREQRGYPSGVTALSTLALLSAGVSPDDPAISKAIDRLLERPAQELANYSISLRVLAMTAADPGGQKYILTIRKDVEVLLLRQIRKGPSLGGWGYNRSNNASGHADSSNTQFAMLALHEAAQIGIEIDDKFWHAAIRYWSNCYNPNDGGFTYAAGGGSTSGSTGSMTCAGITSIVIATENLDSKRDLVDPRGNIICCHSAPEERMVETAIDWLARNFTVRGNPVNQRRAAQQRGEANTMFYYLYGMERAGRLSGRRFFGPHDWYRAGATHLLKLQSSSGAWRGIRGLGEGFKDISTAFALLFLAKGKRPIAIGKLKFGVGNDWNLHPKGVHFLTRELEKQWKTKLNWQTIRSDDATVRDLLEAPVLFMSAKEQLDLAPHQVKELKRYVESGGFIFAEACQGDGCGDDVEFDRRFRQLMADMFPGSSLETLQPDHPVWNSHFPLLPNEKFPLLGLQACCRTSVVYCPRSLSCRWQLNQPRKLAALGNRARAAVAEIEYATRVGVNVVSYATGRQLRDKLDMPNIVADDGAIIHDRVLKIPKLQHGGGSDDAPNALRNILQRARDLGVRLDLEKKLIAPNRKELAGHPFVFMHGRSRFKLNAKERVELKTHLEAGGFLMADSICRSKEFDEAFRKEMRLMFPEDPLEPIPNDHPMWDDDKFGGYDVRNVTITKPDRTVDGGFRKRRGAPQLEGIQVDGEYVVIYSLFDISCAMENATFSQCEGYTREDATKITINVLMYKLNHD